MAIRKFNFNVTKFFIALLVGFLAVQLVTWIASQYFPEVQILKGGPMILLFLIIIGITSLFVLGRKLGQLDLKRDLLFILLVFVGIVLSFIFLPQVIPEIFSTSGMEFSEYIKQTMGAIIGFRTGVV